MKSARTRCPGAVCRVQRQQRRAGFVSSCLRWSLTLTQTTRIDQDPCNLSSVLVCSAYFGDLCDSAVKEPPNILTAETQRAAEVRGGDFKTPSKEPAWLSKDQRSDRMHGE